jgi:hypothetical protein
MNFREYTTQVNKWKLKYGIPHAKFSSKSYNPSLLVVTRLCKKCGMEKPKMNRHHKGSDYTFACLRPDIYAQRYIEFRIEDWDWLCKNDHARYHRWLKPKLEPMYREITNYQALGYEINATWCINWRSKILRWYLEWLAKEPITRKRKKRVKISKR